VPPETQPELSPKERFEKKYGKHATLKICVIVVLFAIAGGILASQQRREREPAVESTSLFEYLCTKLAFEYTKLLPENARVLVIHNANQGLVIEKLRAALTEKKNITVVLSQIPSIEDGEAFAVHASGGYFPKVLSDNADVDGILFLDGMPMVHVADNMLKRSAGKDPPIVGAIDTLDARTQQLILSNTLHLLYAPIGGNRSVIAWDDRKPLSAMELGRDRYAFWTREKVERELPAGATKAP